MKIWTSEYTFDNPWKTVVEGALRKYPNPMNPNVVGLDVLDRRVGKDGILRSHRLMTTKWSVPDWVTPLIGLSRVCYVSEYSEVNPKKKTMTLKSQNLTFCNHITVDEKLVYAQHPKDPKKTLLKQEAVVTINGVPMASYFEGVVRNTMASNANKGRQAIEWVIDNIAEETKRLSKSAEVQMDSLKHSFESNTENLKHSFAKKSTKL